MRERRQHQRWPSYLGADIQFGKRLSVVAGIVKNLSPAGVKLRLRGSTLVPEEFDLVIPQKQAECRMRFRWRQEDFIGAVLLHSHSSERRLSLSQARYMTRLKTENAALKRQLGLEVE